VTARERRPASRHPGIATFLLGADARDGVTAEGKRMLSAVKAGAKRLVEALADFA